MIINRAGRQLCDTKFRLFSCYFLDASISVYHHRNRQLFRVNAMGRIALVFAWLCVIGGIASAQSGMTPFGDSPPAVGATSGVQIPATPPPMFDGTNTQVLRHKDFTGRPCLDVTGQAEPHTIDPNLYDHVVTAVNHCPQAIRIDVCYYGSQDCIPMEIPGDERKEAVLGTMPAEKDFRFEFREKF
jgi:hypothetical protein